MIAVITYLIAIVVANLTLLWFGPQAAIINAFLLIGLDLSLRDKLHDQWEGNHLWLKMLALICGGSAITVVLNWEALPIAIASATAFLAAGIGDGDDVLVPSHTFLYIDHHHQTSFYPSRV